MIPARPPFCVQLLAAIALLLSGAQAGFAATYYVANDGDDSAAGLSAGAPRKTVSSLRGVAAAGDVILLQRGDVFRESVDFTGNGTDGQLENLTFGAYGGADAPNPILSGSLAIGHWQKHEEHIWVAPVDRPVEHLFVDKELMTIARYPNDGWVRVIDGEVTEAGDEALIAPALTEHPRNRDDYWNGATVRWRRWSWVHSVRPAVDYDAKTGRILMKGTDNYSRRDPFWSGFYLDGKLEELDAPGEWYCEGRAGKVYLRAPGDADPNELLVEGAVRESGLKVHGSVVENITFQHQLGNALTITGASRVRGCRFEGTAGSGIFAPWSVGGARVVGNVFADNLNNAITWNENPENGSVSVIADNLIRDTGMVPAYEASEGWYAVGISAYNARQLRVRHNTIDGTGYSGMFIGSPGNYIEYNVIRRAMWTLNDGAGIYTNCDRNVIRHNIITDVRGNLESSHRIPMPDAEERTRQNSWSWANLGHGIWLEFLGDYRGSLVEGNTCARNGGYGLFLPNNFETVVRGNVLYGNHRGQLQLSGRAAYERTGREHNIPQNHRITGNVLCATDGDQSTLTFRPECAYGAMLGNMFIHPQKSAPIHIHGTGAAKWTQNEMSIASWRERFRWADPGATFIGPPEMPEDVKEPTRLVTNESLRVREVPLEDLWLDPELRIVRGLLTLGPHESTVLVRLLPGRLVPAERTAPAAGRLSWCHVVVEQDAEWSAASSADWLVILGEAEGTGPGTVRYKALPNGSVEARQAEIKAAGQAHLVRQAAAETD